jgi:outer membrane protein TolC
VEARARLISAESAVATLADGVPAAEESLDLAQRTYAAGEVSVLPVLQASRQLLTIRGRELDARAELERARILLDHSVGRHVGGALIERPPTGNAAESSSARGRETSSAF